MDFSLTQIAEICGGKIRVGDPQQRIDGFDTLALARSTELSFLGNPKYFPDYLSTEAGAVLVTAETPAGRAGLALIEVENPSLAFSKVLTAGRPQRTFVPGVHPSAFVHETARVEGAMIRANAVVEAGVIVGPGSEVGAGCVIETESKIGEQCLLHGNVTIRERCEVGNRVILQPGVVIGSEGFGYELSEGRHQPIPQIGIVVIEDDVEVGANTTIDRARFGKTRIGEGTKIDNLVQIGHNVVIGKHCLLVANSAIAGSVTLGDYVTVAAQSGMAGHLEVCSNVILAARSGVTKSIKEPGVYWGCPVLPISQERKRVVISNRLPKMSRELRRLSAEMERLSEKNAED